MHFNAALDRKTHLIAKFLVPYIADARALCSS